MGGDADSAWAEAEDRDFPDGDDPDGESGWGADYPDGATGGDGDGPPEPAIWHGGYDDRGDYGDEHGDSDAGYGRGHAGDGYSGGYGGEHGDFGAGYGDEPPFVPPRTRRRRSVVALGAAAVVLVLLAGVAVYEAVGRDHTGAPVAAETAEATAGAGVTTGGSQDAQATQATAAAFLKAWQSGDDAAAAALTDAPAEAKAALDAYHGDLHVSPLVTQVTGADDSGDVSFSVTATVHLPAGAAGPGSAAASGAWTYNSQLAVYDPDGQWRVLWRPDVLAPNLAEGDHLSLLPVSSGAGPTIVTDKQKDDLAGSSEPALQKIATQLSQNASAGGTGSIPGIDVAVVDDTGDPVNGIAPAVVTQPGAQQITTTIDANVQKAASAAVQRAGQSSMVVIQPSTGDILAIANNDGGFDNALMAQIAPGSTMKVVTSAAMLNQGMSMDSDVACPAVLDIGGAITRNSEGESRPSDTPLIDDFAASCNNAFAEQYPMLGGDLLADTAQKYFGLNEPWDIGLGQPTQYFAIPTGQSDAEVAAEAFGQGRLEASPLAMASVAATVGTGTFHQPVVIPGAKRASATPLPSRTDEQLKKMMRAVVTYSDGTAHGIGFGSDVYAKTGTADDQPGDQPNSWIIVYDSSLDLAIGCVVLDAGAGNQFAGPEAVSVLNALS